MNQHYSEALQQLSIHACIFTVFALVYRIRQAHIHKGFTAWVLRAALASLAMAYLHKIFNRIGEDADYATAVDVWREISLLVVLTCRISLRSMFPFVKPDDK